jgi:hypothetical protein
MHIFQLLNLFALTAQIEIVEATLPNVMRSIGRATGEHASRKFQLHCLHNSGWVGDLRLGHQQVDMLGHHNVSNHREAVARASSPGLLGKGPAGRDCRARVRDDNNSR